ncbi:MAG: Macrolide export protein MacA [Verrucomicrobiota bacterium]|jgi:HlyD family secretion protein
MKLPSLRSLLIWFIVAALAGLAVYKLKFAPVPGIGHTVVRGEIIAEVMGTGTLEARVKTTISPRIQERLLEVLADQGDTVKAGQLLARLDDAESKQQVAIAEAALAAARQTAARVQADLARSEAVLAQARLDHDRMTGLVSSKAVSQSDADKSAEALLVAEADLKRSNAAIAESAGQIVVAEKTLLYRQKQLAFTEIHAPYDGLIIRRDRDAGEMLVPGASLMQIISLDELWVSAWVDETAMPALRPDQPARITFRSEPGRSYAGKVSRLGRETDRETREFLVDVRVTTLPENWTIGQRAEVSIETGRQADEVLLPSAFVAWKNGRAGVFIHSGGKARWREITPGLRGADRMSVTKGLASGDQVLRHYEGGKTVLADGQRVKLP